MLGLKRHIVQLTPHQASWAKIYAEEAQKVQKLLAPLFLDLQHIGSTSIKGIHAKAIIDIGVLVENLEHFSTFETQLASLGYTYRGDAGTSGGHVFVLNIEGDIRTHHIHLIAKGDPQWENYLFFRDYLNQHPEEARDYSAFKQKLAKQFPKNRGAYTKAKTEFIQRILSRK